MKILLSPAKTLDFGRNLPTSRGTQPKFINDSALLINVLKSKCKKEIADLMNISDKLAQLNFDRYQDFSLPFTKENARPAVFAFAGDVYEGFDAYTLKEKHYDKIQSSLRILSGLYGLLRPFDLIQPYRLEMGVKLEANGKKNLYDFWKEKLTIELNSQLNDEEMLLNLASVEYVKAVDSSKLKVPMVSPIFKDFKNGELKIISFYAKKARGSMARFVIENNIHTIEDLKSFDLDGYNYSELYSENNYVPVFVR